MVISDDVPLAGTSKGIDETSTDGDPKEQLSDYLDDTQSGRVAGLSAQV